MIQKIRDKLNIQTVIRVVPTALFLLFIFYVMIHTYTDKVKTVVTDTKLSVESLEKLSDSFEKTLQDNIFDKNNYIDLNGLTTRIFGINSLNERQKLTDGFLAEFEQIKNVEKATTELIELSEFLNDRGIPFLYILAPSKASFYNAQFAPGYGSDSWQNIDTVIDTLDDAGVNNFDMDAYFKKNAWSMEDVFFATDHHWLPQAGLQAAKLYMEYLSREGLAEYHPETLDEENWDVTVYENWFLGSEGKRTGTIYTGTDDFPVYVPKFETDYSYAYLNNGTTNWIYKDTPLNLAHFDNKDYFNNDVYGVYLFGSYQIHILTNAKAYNEQKVLVLGDSFRRSFEYFLTTQFQEVYGVDLRFYSDGSLAQFIEETQPDIVVMLLYEDNLTNKDHYTFGIEEYLSALSETEASAESIFLGDFEVEADEDQNNIFEIIYSNLEPGQTYTLTLNTTEYSGGEDQFVQMTLQDISSNKAISNRYFDVNSDETQKWIFTVPEEVASYSVYLYAGTKGHTANVLVNVSNVKLRKGIFED